MIRVVFGKACGFYPEGSQEGRVIDGFQVFIRHSTRLIPGWPRMLRCSTFGIFTQQQLPWQFYSQHFSRT